MSKKIKKVDRVYPEATDFKRLATVVAYDVCGEENELSDDGKIVKKAVKKMFDPVKEMNKFKVNDFCMENMIATGAVQNLKPVKLVGADVDDVIDEIEKASDYFDYEYEKSRIESSQNSVSEGE